MTSGAGLDPVLAQLARHPVTLDAPGLLAQEPLTLAALSARLRTRRRTVEAALRVLAAHGMVSRRDQAGSWDERGAAPVLYQLTRAGQDLDRRLQRFDTLVAIYEHLLCGEPSEDSAQR
ncbi:MAG TPA: hypothetical protein VHC18_02785 [Amycolatopsis sp.]|nr:hypothetical protein [Amycolatopsis sp.]